MKIARPSWWRRWFGTRSERAVERYLRRQGMRILSRNYICSAGELDLVAADGRCVVFVEVRSTEQGSLLATAESVDRKKQRRVCRAATDFIYRHRLEKLQARFDVVALRWPETRPEPEILHFRHAFNDAEDGS